MMHLSELQSRFQSFILCPENGEEISWVGGTEQVPSRFRLSVYANAYVLRLKEVLETDYPAVNRAIGDDRFGLLAERYIRQHPSRFFSLRDFGARFAAYLGEQIDIEASLRDLAWLPELAQFEWTLGLAFDSADATLLDEQDMASIPADAWPALQFEFCPSVHRIDLEWNIPVMWKSLTADPPETVEALRTPGSWLVWRQNLVTRFRSLDEDERLIFDLLYRQGSFNDGCEILASQIGHEGASMRAASLLKGWIGQGLIADAVRTS
ncbi:MAG: DNA-binding domain-containing protein [Candidatus Thiodiazotropha sp. (ex Ctena orbiculata)]|nr:DNA-binding domain-containing protein [Candidatus Thiodiazotropha taylori]